MVNKTRQPGSELHPLRLRKARLATFVSFFQLGVMVFAWSTGTSSFRAQLGIDGGEGDSAYGMVALSIGIGCAIGCFSGGPIMDRVGARRVLAFCLVLFPLSLIPLAFVPGVGAAFACGLVMGVVRGAVDTASNVHGVEVERHYRRPIMSAFQAAYPAGGFVGGLIGSALAGQFTDSPAMSFTLIGVTMALIGLVVRRWLLKPEELLPHDTELVEGQQPVQNRSTFVVTALMVGFGVLLLASMLSEGAPIDWGQEFVRRGLDSTTSAAALAVTLYSGAQFVGRLFGDRLTEFLGPRRMLLGSSVVALIGLGLMSLSISLPITYLGFVLLGLGLAAEAPLMLSAAGRIDPANAGRNVGIVNGLGYSGLLVGPASITLVVDKAGLSWMPLMPIAFMLCIALFGSLLMRFAPKFTPTSRQEEPSHA